nr:retinoblastoma binding protein [Hymenolepis microstoma]
MASEVYFRFKASIKQDTIQFDGSAISVKDLKNAIKTKCCLRASDFDLKLEDGSGKEYIKENELIPKYTSIIVRRVPKANGESQRKKPLQVTVSREKNFGNSSLTHSNSATNLAESNLSEDDKIKIMFDRTAEGLSSKYYTVKPKAYGVPPPHYICHKCNQEGHWIHECPGIKDSRGNLLDSKTVKRPTGIPQDFLVRVEPGTPGAYLDKNGRYMVPIKDAEAYLQSKKEKRPFSIEENPPYVPPEKPIPSEGLLCPLCKNICKSAVLVTCCGTSYCSECITNYCFVDGHHKCPNCGAPKEKLESSIVENASLRRAIEDFLLVDIKPEISNIPSPPKPTPEVKESEIVKSEIVRRVLKPKQQIATTSVPSAEENPEDKPEEVVQEKQEEGVKEIKEDDSPKETVAESNSPKPSQPSSSPPSVTVKSDSSVNKPSDSVASVISNTNSLANMPCGNNSLGTESVIANLSNVASVYNGAPLVFPSENAASAVSLASLAALSSVGQSQPPLNSVFPTNQLLPWAPIDQLSLLGCINPNGFSNPSLNPLLDARGKVLSKEEFYGIQRKYAEESERRRRRCRDTSPRHRRDVSDDYYSRHRDDRRVRRRSPIVTSRRHRSRSGSDRRHRNRERKRDDYETWLRKKREAIALKNHHRPSPYRPRRSDSPILSTAVSVPRRDYSREISPVERTRRSENNVDKSRLRSPFHDGSPSRRSLEDVSPVHDDSSRAENRSNIEPDTTPVRSSRRSSASREDSVSFCASISQLSNPEVELDEKTIKKIRKEQKKKAKRERKLARKAARAAKKATLTAGEGDNFNSPLPLSPSSSKSKKKRRRRHRHEYSESDDGESGSKSSRRKRSRSKRSAGSDLDEEDAS